MSFHLGYQGKTSGFQRRWDMAILRRRKQPFVGLKETNLSAQEGETSYPPGLQGPLRKKEIASRFRAVPQSHIYRKEPG